MKESQECEASLRAPESGFISTTRDVSHVLLHAVGSEGMAGIYRCCRLFGVKPTRSA